MSTSIFAIMCCIAIGHGQQQCHSADASYHHGDLACGLQMDRMEHIEGETCRCLEYHAERTCKPQAFTPPPPPIERNPDGSAWGSHMSAH